LVEESLECYDNQYTRKEWEKEKSQNGSEWDNSLEDACNQ
jgi:hypothetical protein